MATGKTPLSFTIQLADGTQRVVESESEKITIGSSKEAHVTIEDPSIAGTHCLLRVKEGPKVTLVDLGTDAGTKVHGRVIEEESQLQDGDILEIGATSVTVHFGGAVLSPTVPGRVPAGLEDMTEEQGDDATEVIHTEENLRAHTLEKTEKASMTENEQNIVENPSLVTREPPKGKTYSEVAFHWGSALMGVKRLSPGENLVLGTEDGADFVLSAEQLTANHTLVEQTETGATVKLAAGMTATVNGKETSGDIQLDKDDVAQVTMGALTFTIRYSNQIPPLLADLSKTWDSLYTKTLAFALILQTAFLIAFFITPSFEEFEDDDLFNNPNFFQELILREPEEKKEKKEDLSGKKAAQHKEDEGLFGKKDKPKEDKVASSEGAPVVDKDKREEDRKIAMEALAALGLGPESQVSDVMGPGGLGSGINNALGGLRGTAMGDAGGAGGLGTRGTGAGGGGNALGIGGLGSGTGRGSGGNGNIDLGGRGKGMTRIRPGKVTYKGSLSREEIQRVVKRHMNQIKYCYEKQLAKSPNLQGKVVAFWVIAGTGLVQTAKASQNTMSNKAVEKCIIKVVKRMRFPRPKGGGVVTVTYPFVFSSSG
jgi:pSer/pThr/pTyr-binding forkhead associated (FHA) protein